jgi:Zn-dependent M16 (insulinase) family peptidase
MKQINFYIFILSLTAFFAGCQPQTAPQSNQTANTNANITTANVQWGKYVEGFLNEYFVANPQVAVYSGKHEFDGKLPDWSEDGLKKEIARLKAERDKAAAFKDDQLDEQQRFERDYLIAQIDKDRTFSN